MSISFAISAIADQQAHRPVRYVGMPDSWERDVWLEPNRPAAPIPCEYP